MRRTWQSVSQVRSAGPEQFLKLQEDDCDHEERTEGERGIFLIITKVKNFGKRQKYLKGIRKLLV